MGARGFLRIVLAAGTGAVAVIAPLWIVFALEPGLNDKWPLFFGAAALCGALLLGSLVGGVLTHAGTDPAAARRAERRVLLFSFGATILALAYVMARALDDVS